MSNMLEQHNADIRRAAYFFAQQHWQRLLEAIYSKYIAQGRVGGQVTLQACSADELREIARFLGKRVPARAEITVRLVDFQQALTTSSFNCSLPELLAACFPERPLRTRPEQRVQRVQDQQRFYEALTTLGESLSTDSPGAWWLLQGAHGRESLFQRYKNKTPALQKILLQQVSTIANGLNGLPEPPQYERLSLFSQRISGDPHFLDSKLVTGRIFLQALSDLRQRAHTAYALDEAMPEDTSENIQDAPDEAIPEEGNESSPEQEQQRLLQYYEAGLLVDTISSTVAVFHLAAAEDHAGERDPLIAHAGPRVLSLPLRQLLAWRRLDPVGEHIYLFENPQVFERIVDDLLQQSSLPAERLPTLVCTSGWPSVASIRLLNLITEAHPGVVLHYSGDFDVQGMRIAAHLCARYRQCQPWHFDVATYQAALHSADTPLTRNELAMLHGLPSVFTPLVTALQERQQKAYQEAITQMLLVDILSDKYRERV